MQPFQRKLQPSIAKPSGPTSKIDVGMPMTRLAPQHPSNTQASLHRWHDVQSQQRDGHSTAGRSNDCQSNERHSNEQ